MVAMISGVSPTLSKCFANTADGHVHGAVVGLEFAARHLLEQLGTGLDLARVLAEMQHGAELGAGQLEHVPCRADQGAAVDVQGPAIEQITFPLLLFATGGTFMVRLSRLRARMVSSRGLNGLVM